MPLRKTFDRRFGWRRRLAVTAVAAALGAGVGVTATAAGLFGGSPPDPNDVARPAGVPGTPGALTEVRKCAGPNGTTNWVVMTLAPKDTPANPNAGPVTPAHLACGPKDRVP